MVGNSDFENAGYHDMDDEMAGNAGYQQFNMGGMPRGGTFKMSGNMGNNANIDPSEILKMFFGGMGGMGGMGGKGGQFFTSSSGGENDFGGMGGFGGFQNMGSFGKQGGAKKTSFKFS